MDGTWREPAFPPIYVPLPLPLSPRDNTDFDTFPVVGWPDRRKEERNKEGRKAEGLRGLGSPCSVLCSVHPERNRCAYPTEPKFYLRQVVYYACRSIGRSVGRRLPSPNEQRGPRTRAETLPKCRISYLTPRPASEWSRSRARALGQRPHGERGCLLLCMASPFLPRSCRAVRMRLHESRHFTT